MALAPSVATSVDPSAAERPGKGGGGTKVVLILAFAVFFLLGGVTNINDLLVGKFKPMFHLTHAEANLVQMAFFIAYGAFSIPAGIIMSKLGYIRTFVLGFIIVAARSEESRVGNECVRTCSSRGWRSHYKKKRKNNTK